MTRMAYLSVQEIVWSVLSGQRDVVIFVAFAPMCVCKDLTLQAV